MTGVAPPALDDTIVAVASAPGPGYRAIVRLSGPRSHELAGAVFTPTGPLHGTIRVRDVYRPLDGFRLARRGPRTATGQDVAELHVISSPPIVERLVADLIVAGARAARPGEFTMRAFLAGKKDLPQAEAVLAVIEAGSDGELTEALAQLAGSLSRPLDLVRDDLLNLLADLEAGLDFVEEDISFVTTDDIRQRIDAAGRQLQSVLTQLDDRGTGDRPARVVLVGRPNAGKSALFNALVGRDAAIVSPVAGTTWDYVTHFDRDANVEYVDTAGVGLPQDDLDDRAQSLGRTQASRAELRLVCVPAGEAMPAEFTIDDRTLVVRTMGDLTPAEPDAVSAVTGRGLAALRESIRFRLQSQRRPALAPSLARCRGHVTAALAALQSARSQPHHELTAADLRTALAAIGELTGTLLTDDLLDRVFSRFCVGK
jgi:tRNA modification GTPase